MPEPQPATVGAVLAHEIGVRARRPDQRAQPRGPPERLHARSAHGPGELWSNAKPARVSRAPGTKAPAAAPWVSTPSYTSIAGTGVSGTQDYRGASSDLSRLFIQPAANLLARRHELRLRAAPASTKSPVSERRRRRFGSSTSATKEEGELKIGGTGALLGDRAILKYWAPPTTRSPKTARRCSSVRRRPPTRSRPGNSRRCTRASSAAAPLRKPKGKDGNDRGLQPVPVGVRRECTERTASRRPSRAPRRTGRRSSSRPPSSCCPGDKDETTDLYEYDEVEADGPPRAALQRRQHRPAPRRNAPKSRVSCAPHPTARTCTSSPRAC